MHQTRILHTLSNPKLSHNLTDPTLLLNTKLKYDDLYPISLAALKNTPPINLATPNPRNLGAVINPPLQTCEHLPGKFGLI
jgi:hypothetical protein